MDGVTSGTAPRQPGDLQGPAIAGMPPEVPGEMPAQRLDRFDRTRRRAVMKPDGRSDPVRRALFVVGSLLLIAYAVSEMYGVLAIGDMTPVEWIVLVLFAVTFAWIAMAFVSSAGGFLRLLGRHFGGSSTPAAFRLAGRTAVLMPTYNEDPSRIFAAIEAMAVAVHGLGHAAAFDWVVLSDTTDPDVALEEETAFLAARRRLGDRARLHYRRRRNNVAKKAGNVADFCRRWGRAFDHLLVLDADSLMDGETIVELARRMEADPDAGLIQTIPMLVNGTTVVARLLQFAGRVYGPVVGTGLSWWVQKEGNFWGHNAIIRTEAFMSAAGLPDLPGRAPFGGHILSHDFVEAALIRRAGWTVIIADDLTGSFEESPPSLVDLAIRDRRWCQGNLQHLKVVGARGLHWVSRMHLVTGIMSYMASPLWLLLILAGLALSLQAHFIRPEYFKDEFQLFPSWPRIDPERALALFGLTMAILFGPKLMGLTVFLFDGRARRRAGGTVRVMASFLFEVVVSALIAPIMMLVQTGAVAEILMRRDAGWKPQRRDDGGLPIGALIHRHRWHVAFGVFLALAASADSLVLVAWLSPAIAGLVLAVPISAATGSAAVGRLVRAAGLLRTPEEADPPPIRHAMEAARPAYRDAIALAPDLVRLATDPMWRRQHLALVDRLGERPRGKVDPTAALAAARIGEAETVEEAVGFLDARERATVLATPRLIEALARLPRAGSGPGEGSFAAAE